MIRSTSIISEVVKVILGLGDDSIVPAGADAAVYFPLAFFLFLR